MLAADACNRYDMMGLPVQCLRVTFDIAPDTTSTEESCNLREDDWLEVKDAQLAKVMPDGQEKRGAHRGPLGNR